MKKIFEFFFQSTEITHEDIPKDVHKFKIVYRNFFEKATPIVYSTESLATKRERDPEYTYLPQQHILTFSTNTTVHDTVWH